MRKSIWKPFLHTHLPTYHIKSYFARQEMPAYHTLINVCGQASREHLDTLSDELIHNHRHVWRKHIHYTIGSATN